MVKILTPAAFVSFLGDRVSIARTSQPISANMAVESLIVDDVAALELVCALADLGADFEYEELVRLTSLEGIYKAYAARTVADSVVGKREILPPLRSA